jgi:PEP-CTERM motif-containing protein
VTDLTFHRFICIEISGKNLLKLVRCLRVLTTLPMSKIASIALSGFALTLIVTPALATSITFAEFTQTGTADFSLNSVLVSPSGDTFRITIAGAVAINFDYLFPNTSFGLTPQAATLNFTAISTLGGSCPPPVAPDNPCVAAGQSYTESGYSGNFQILLADQRNLLSGTFGPSLDPLPAGATFSSTVGATTSALQATTTSSNPIQLTFTSDFLNFADTSPHSATFNFQQPAFSVFVSTGTSKFYPSIFTAFASDGSFFADVTAPEPSTFALLASALLGLCLWQRKRRQLHR